MPLVNEDAAINVLDLQIPRVVRLSGSHKHCGHLISGVDVGHFILHELHHDLIVEDANIESGTLEVLEELGLLASGPVPLLVVLVNVTTFLGVLNELRLETRLSLQNLASVLLKELPVSLNIDREVSEVRSEHLGHITHPEVLPGLLFTRLSLEIHLPSESLLVETTTSLVRLMRLALVGHLLSSLLAFGSLLLTNASTTLSG